MENSKEDRLVGKQMNSQDRFLIKFKEKVAKKMLEMGETGVPFCNACAEKAYEKEVNRRVESIQDRYGSGDPKKYQEAISKLNELDIDLRRFEGESCFDKQQDSEQTDWTYINGIKTPVRVIYKAYKCKEYGHKVSIRQRLEHKKEDKVKDPKQSK